VKAPRFEDVYSQENLCVAWHKVSLGKSDKPSMQEFYRALDRNLAALSRELENGSYRPGRHTRFLVKDPKERVISAAPVRDRVVQHALMNLYAPVFDRHLIHDCYACRIGRGTHKAVLRAFHFAKSSRYFLKMDVQKYFDSVDHAVLKSMLARLVAEPRALCLFSLIIDTGGAALGKGMPIGNLTSQYFVNHYLSSFDHHFKERLRARRYIRYMDDILVFSDDKNAVGDFYAGAVDFAGEKLRLALKPRVSGPVADGVPFLGFLVKPSGIYLHKKTKRRYKARIAGIEHNLKRGILGEVEAGSRAESVTAHLLLARSLNFRNTVLCGRVLGV